MTTVLALWCALAASIGASRPALAESATRGLRAASFFAVVAMGTLTWAFVTQDFAVRVVVENTSASLPPPWRVAALFASLGPRLLAFAAVVAIGAVWRVRIIARNDDGAASTARAAYPALAGAVVAVACGAAVGAGNPFEELGAAASEGRGLDPSLQSLTAALDAPLAIVSLAALMLWALVVSAHLADRRTRGHADGPAAVRAASSALALLVALAAVRLYGAYVIEGTPITAAAELAATGQWLIVATVGVTAWLALFARRARRGIAAASAGALLAATGLAGGANARTSTVRLGDGERLAVRDGFGASWAITSQGASRIEGAGHLRTSVTFQVVRDSGRVRYASAEVREYPSPIDPTTAEVRVRPAVVRGVWQDVRLFLLSGSAGESTVRVEFMPLVSLTWIGAALLVVAAPFAFQARAGQRLHPDPAP